MFSVPTARILSDGGSDPAGIFSHEREAGRYQIVQRSHMLPHPRQFVIFYQHSGPGCSAAETNLSGSLFVFSEAKTWDNNKKRRRKSHVNGDEPSWSPTILNVDICLNAACDINKRQTIEVVSQV